MRCSTSGWLRVADLPDRWRCRWCLTYTHPVATLVTDHEAECVARPVRVVA
jgi:hypothetical protein